MTVNNRGIIEYLNDLAVPDELDIEESSLALLIEIYPVIETLHKATELTKSDEAGLEAGILAGLAGILEFLQEGINLGIIDAEGLEDPEFTIGDFQAGTKQAASDPLSLIQSFRTLARVYSTKQQEWAGGFNLGIATAYQTVYAWLTGSLVADRVSRAEGMGGTPPTKEEEFLPEIVEEEMGEMEPDPLSDPEPQELGEDGPSLDNFVRSLSVIITSGLEISVLSDDLPGKEGIWTACVNTPDAAMSPGYLRSLADIGDALMALELAPTFRGMDGKIEIVVSAEGV